MLTIENAKIEKIYASTLQLVAEFGIHNTPMSSIARHSGVAIGTIYHYFKNKDALLNSLYLELKEDLIYAIMRDVKNTGSYKQNFLRLWQNYFDYLIKHPPILLFIEQSINTPIITSETRKSAEKTSFPLIDFFQAGIDTGTLKVQDVPTIIALVHGSVVSIAKMHISRQMKVRPADKLAIAGYSWKGLT